MQANTKLSELRIAFDKLKIEATRMHKALVRECGEDVPIDKILSGLQRVFSPSHRLHSHTPCARTAPTDATYVHSVTSFDVHSLPLSSHRRRQLAWSCAANFSFE